MKTHNYTQASKKHISGVVSLAVAALLLGNLGPAVGGQGNVNNPNIVPPQSHYRGQTYSEWSAEWWEWVYSLPVTNHPLFDNADCSTGQRGDVWFIDGKRGGDEPFPPGGRNCTIPPDTALFLAVAARNQDNGNCNGSTIQPTNDSVPVLRAKAYENLNSFLDTRVVTIDGVPVNGLPSCDPTSPDTCRSAYRVQSPVFTYNHVPAFNNLLIDDYGDCYRDPKGDGSSFKVQGAVADGVYLMIKPLNPGEHKLRFGPIGSDGLPTRLYNITVKPFKHHSVTSHWDNWDQGNEFQ